MADAELELEPHFAVSHSGYPMEDFVLTSRDGMATLFFVCQTCASLTSEPQDHARWHNHQGQILLRDVALLLNAAAASKETT